VPDEIERSEVEAALAARHELGPEYDAAFVEAFAERIEQVVAQRSSAVAVHQAHADEGGSRQFVLGIVSLGTGIPITAIAGGITGLPGIITAWAGIVGVNVAHSLSNRSRRR
jgi:hypothetical protein